jgi:hypothetical protein
MPSGRMVQMEVAVFLPMAARYGGVKPLAKCAHFAHVP